MKTITGTQIGSPEWRSVLRHCNAEQDPGSSLCPLLQRAATGRPMGRCTIGPLSSRLGDGLAGRDVLVPSRTSDSRGRPGTMLGAMHTDTVARCTVFPLTHWCG